MDPEIEKKHYRQIFPKVPCRISENLFLNMSFPTFELSDMETYLNSENLICNLAPLLADHLKRSVPFDKILDVFIKFDSKHNKNPDVQFENISSRNLIEFLLQICPPEFNSLIGGYLFRMQRAIPLSYWTYHVKENEPKKSKLRFYADLSVLLSLLPQISQRIVILNFGLDSNIGKTELISELFNLNKDGLNLNNNRGLAREGTTDLYFTESFIIIDINDFFGQFQKFLNFFKELVRLCHAFIIHVDASKGKKHILKSVKELENNFGFKYFEKSFLIFRDSENSEIENCLRKSTICLNEKITLSAKRTRKEMMILNEKFKKWLSSLSLNDKKSKFNLKNIFKTRLENLETIEKIFQIEETETPFELILPFSSAQYKEFKATECLENLGSIIKNFRKKDIKLRSLLSYRFAKYAMAKDFIELRKFDEEIKLRTTTFLEKSKKKIDKLSEEGHNKMNRRLSQELSEISEMHTNNSITSQDLYAELFAYYDYKKNETFNNFTSIEQTFFEDFKLFFSLSLNDGLKLQMLRGVPLKIRNEFFNELFAVPLLNKNLNYYVISILGLQSSGKSTLLNYLFGCDFEISSGRCTRGIYVNIVKTPDPSTKILVLDTEGLSSVEMGDRSFDHKMALMCLGLSDLVILNQNGEITKHVQDLLSISLYAMNYFQQMRGCVPKVFFVLRNMMDRSTKNQESQLKRLEIELNSLAIAKSIEQKIKISTEFLFLMPSAFNESGSNTAFGESIFSLRKKIWSQVELTDRRRRQLHDIYISAVSLWDLFEKYGQKLLSCDTLKEYETKMNVEEKLKMLGRTKVRDLIKIINLELIEKLTRLEYIEESQYFDALIRSRFKKEFKNLEEEFEKIRNEFPGYGKLVENGIQDLQDFFRCEESNLVYGWDFKFKQKVKELKLKRLETEFSLKINEKMKLLIEKSSLKDSENAFEIYINKKVNGFLGERDEIIIKNQKEEMEDVLKVFKGFQKLELDEITLKKVDDFKKKGFSKVDWKTMKIKLKGSNSKNKPSSYKNKKQVNVKNDDMTNLELMIDSFFGSMTNDPSMVSLAEAKSEEFFEFLEKIRTDPQFSELNFDFIKHELCFKFISTTAEVIYINKKRDSEELKQTYLNNAEKKRAEYVELYINRKNNLKTIENICINYLNRIIEVKVKELKAHTFEAIEKKLENIPIDPEKFLDYAYKESFIKRNPEAIWHFVTDINGYVSSIFKGLAKEILEDVLTKMKQSFQKTVLDEIENYKKAILNFLESQDAVFNSEDLFESIKKIFKEIDLKYDQLFPREIKTDDLRKFIQCENFLQNIRNLENHIQTLEDNVKHFLQGKKEIIMGCQLTCPSCRSKCVKPAGNHENHKAYHLLNCFGGVNEVKTKEVVKLFCLEKENIELEWMNNGQKYGNLIEMCEDSFKNWVDEFKKNQSILNEKEKQNQLVCWFYVHKPLLKKYGAKDNKLEVSLNEGQVLPENYVSNLF